MKSNLLSSVSFVAYVVALAALAVSPLAAGLIATIAGLLSISTLDYGRSSGPVAIPAEVIPFSSKMPVLDDSRHAA